MTLKAVRLLGGAVLAAPQTKTRRDAGPAHRCRGDRPQGKTVVPLSFSMNRIPLCWSRPTRAARTVAEFLDRGKDVAMLNLERVHLRRLLVSCGASAGAGL
ncbi:MAG: hypothetical protein ACLTYN_03815 [Dysosmobacter welbionis]